MIKLVLSDMDGTLVPNSAKTTSERTRHAIDRLRESGIVFGCATGRSITNTIMQFSDMPEYVTDGIFAAGKQALVRGGLVRDMPVPRALIEELVEGFKDFDDALLVSFIYGMDPEHPGDTVPCSLGEDRGKIDRILEYYLAPGRNGNLWDNWQWLDGIPDADIYMLGVLAAGGQEGVPRVARYFEEHFPSTTVLNSAPGWCDVNVGVTTKATPFAEFLAAEGFEPDEVVFFADSDNDIELMKLIPNSVCVANAMPSAAGLARYTVPADVEDGPAQLMEALAQTSGDLEEALSLFG
jgi:hydroxymethylpyrimidine pyrophosphatase-like HAD family hydrolase